jgi:hypothetical protein
MKKTALLLTAAEPSGRGGASTFQYISQLVTAKFPAQRNRELSQTNRELASSYQGRQEGERSLLPERTPTSLPPL